MSGLEVLGGLAASIQLVETGFKIIALISRLRSSVHDTPQSLTRRLTQIQQLTKIAGLIRENEALQTDLVSGVLEACLKDARDLEQVLGTMADKLEAGKGGKMKRYWRAAVDEVVGKEKKIEGLCESLEESKSALVLCVVSVGSDQSAKIESDVRKVIETLPTIEEISGGVNVLLKETESTKSANLEMQQDLKLLLAKVTTMSETAISEPPAYTSTEEERPISEDQSYIREQLSALSVALERLTVVNSLQVERPGDHRKDTRPLPSFADTIKCLNSLPAIDQKMLLKSRTNNDRSKCQWFLQGERYRRWKTCLPADLLYITARAGCGKTTLALQIVDSLYGGQQSLATAQNILDDMSGPHDQPIILFFFFNRSNQLKQSTNLTATATLISQMIRQRPTLLHLLYQEYGMNEARGDISWSFDLLWNIFLDMINDTRVNEEILIIIDALDECQDEAGLGFLERLIALTQDVSKEGSGVRMIRILITGRREEQVFDIIPSLQHYEITSADTQEDLHELVTDGVAALTTRRSFSSEIQQMIRTTLEESADGMFIWVVLVLKELSLRDRRITSESIAAKLKSLPRQLASMYDSILQAIPETRRQEFWTIIRWLVFSRGHLSCPQLCDLLCLELDIPDWQEFEADLAYICGAFIQIEPNRVQLIHQTARDFLLKYIENATLEQSCGIDLRSSPAEAALATVCIKTLLRDKMIHSLGYTKAFPLSNRGFQKMRDFITNNPTFSYAAKHWADHLSHINEADITPALTSLAMTLLEKRRARDAIMRLNYNFRYPGQLGCPADASTLHLASYFNLHFLVKASIENGHDIDETSNAGDTPLIWASEMGSLRCAEALLAAGADPNIVEVDGWSPLHWTAANGHTKLCKLLLGNGADPDAEDAHGLSALDWARQHSHTQVIKLLYPVTKRNGGGGFDSQVSGDAAVKWKGSRVRPACLHSPPAIILVGEDI